jgi:hypothetical protein
MKKINVESIGEFETSGNFKEKTKGKDGKGGRKGVARPKGNGASHFFDTSFFFFD